MITVVLEVQSMTRFRGLPPDCTRVCTGGPLPENFGGPMREPWAGNRSRRRPSAPQSSGAAGSTARPEFPIQEQQCDDDQSYCDDLEGDHEHAEFHGVHTERVHYQADDDRGGKINEHIDLVWCGVIDEPSATPEWCDRGSG
jgi:hypothetical protein